jgi:DNA-binding LacI/PurR family transcriptional regulator
VELLAQEMGQRIAAGDWKGTLPGMLRLASELGVSRESVERALQLLTRDGILAPPEHGQARRILCIPRPAAAPSGPRRIGWLAWRPLVLMDRATRETIAEVTRLASSENAEVFVAPFSGSQIRHPARELAALLATQSADVWIVQGGTTEIYQWFAAAKLPCLAVGGRIGDSGLGQIGFDMGEQIAAATDHLLSLGHRRIVLPLPPQTPREGPPGRFESAFRARMEAAGARVSADFNLPILHGDPASWQQLLHTLFAFTPPTAFILYNGTEAAGLCGFLQQRGLRIPEDVSLVVEADEPLLQWLLPEPSRIEFSPLKLARAIWKWVREALHGEPGHTRRLISGSFVKGRTTAPPKAG